MAGLFIRESKPVKAVVQTINKRLCDIVNAIVLQADNRLADNNNSLIQGVKKRGRGFRNKQQFKNSTVFHRGNLDLYPTGVYQNLTPESEDIAYSF